MAESEKTTNVVSRNAQPIHVKLTRGAKGDYRWEIEDMGDNADAILYTINYLDDQLRGRYLPAQPNPTGFTVDKPALPADPHQRMDAQLKRIREIGEKLNKGGEQPI